MKISTQKLIAVIITLAGAMLAAFLITRKDNSLLAFIGWALFFASITTPAAFLPKSSQQCCPKWFTSFRRKFE